MTSRNSVFQAVKGSDMVCAELQGDLFVDCQEWYFQGAKLKDKSTISCKRVDLLMLRNSVFRVRNVEIWAVLSSNEVDLLMHRNRVFRLRNVEKCAVPSRKGVVLFILRNRVF